MAKMKNEKAVKRTGEVTALINSIKFDNEKITGILNPDMAKGVSPEKSYAEARSNLKESVLSVKWAEAVEDEEEAGILDDYELINSKLKDLGLLKLALENAEEDLGVISEALPGLKKDASVIKGLIMERERL